MVPGGEHGEQLQIGCGAAPGSELSMRVCAEADLQESGMVQRNMSVDCESWVLLSETMTLTNCYIYICRCIYIAFLLTTI